MCADDPLMKQQAATAAAHVQLAKQEHGETAGKYMACRNSGGVYVICKRIYISCERIGRIVCARIAFLSRPWFVHEAKNGTSTQHAP